MVGKRLRHGGWIKPGSNVREGPSRALAVRAGGRDEFVDLALGKREAVQIHLEQCAPLFVTWALKLFHDCGPALQGGIQHRQTIGAQEHDNPAPRHAAGHLRIGSKC